MNDIQKQIEEAKQLVKLRKKDLSNANIALNELYLEELRLDVEQSISDRLRETVSGWDED